MKNTLLLLLFLSGAVTISVAQRPQGRGPAGGQAPSKEIGSGNIQGIIIDSISNSPVEFAAIALWTGGKAVDGALTGLNGKFKFEALSKGTYKILISYIGYKAQSIENVLLKNSSSKVDLKEIMLVGENIQLDAVTVTSQAALIEDRIDKLVYHADKDISK